MTPSQPTEPTPVRAQGDPGLLEEPAAQRLLHSAIPARMAYLNRNGEPRIVPTWFHWTGTDVVMVTYVAGPRAGIVHAARRLADLRVNPQVTISIDTNDFPPTILQMRGRVDIVEVDGIAAEYAAAARRYLGAAAAAELLVSIDQPGTRQARTILRPTWVSLLDFTTRLPSAQGGTR